MPPPRRSAAPTPERASNRRDVLTHSPLDALYRASSEAEGFSDLEDAKPFGEVASDSPLHRARHLWPPKPLSLCPGAAQTGADALPDHGTLELGKGPTYPNIKRPVGVLSGGG